jgi:SH3 domain-containing YSC84-like protein 1
VKQITSMLLVAAPLVVIGTVGGSAFAADPVNAPPANFASPPETTANAPAADLKGQAARLIQQATAEVKKMTVDPKLKQLMAKAKGIYLVPEFGSGASGGGGRRGAGVVLLKNNGEWSNPGFYDFGAISGGTDDKSSHGAVALLLMNDAAVNAFKAGRTMTMNADAGVAILSYSAQGEASWGTGAIIMWSDTPGPAVGAAISVTDLEWAADNNAAYYGQKVQPDQVLTGAAKTPDAAELKEALRG